MRGHDSKIVPDGQPLFAHAWRELQLDIAPVSFTTAAARPLSVTLDSIHLSMSDQNGVVTMTVTAAAGSLPAGPSVPIANAGNGVLASFLAGNCFLSPHRPRRSV